MRPYIWNLYLLYGLAGTAVLAQIVLAYRKGPDGVWIARRWALWVIVFLYVVVSSAEDIAILLGLRDTTGPEGSALASRLAVQDINLSLMMLGWYLVGLTVSGGMIAAITVLFSRDRSETGARGSRQAPDLPVPPDRR